MNLRDFTPIASPFKEHPFCNSNIQEPELFEISIQGEFDLQLYCEAILEKLQSFSRSDLKPFIEYQCTLMKNPIYWLNKTEKLIQVNSKFFQDDTTRICKLYSVIEVLRDKLQNQTDEKRDFDFNKLKKQLESLNTYAEKHKLLLENLTLLKQSNVLNHSELNDKHIKLLELEISKLIDLQPLEGQIKGLNENLTYPRSRKKIKLNGHINVIVDVFYQAMRELRVEGKPYIDASIKDVAELICDNFLDVNGNEIGNATVQTMLSPKKSDKRPKGENRFILANG